MGSQQSFDENPDGLTRFERARRIERWLSCIAHTILALALAYYVYGVKAEIDESNAVIEACKRDTSWKCMDKAREAYRKSH